MSPGPSRYPAVEKQVAPIRFHSPHLQDLSPQILLWVKYYFGRREEFWNEIYRETPPLQSSSKPNSWQSVFSTAESHLFWQTGKDTETVEKPRVIFRWAQPQTLMQSGDWMLSPLSQGMVLAWLVEPRDPPRVTQELSAWQTKFSSTHVTSTYYSYLSPKSLLLPLEMQKCQIPEQEWSDHH